MKFLLKQTSLLPRHVWISVYVLSSCNSHFFIESQNNVQQYTLSQ